MIWTCVSVGSGNASIVRFLNAKSPAARSTAVRTKVAMRWEREKSSRRSSIESADRHGSCHGARGELRPAYGLLVSRKSPRHKKRSGHNSTCGEITPRRRRKILRKSALGRLRSGPCQPLSKMRTELEVREMLPTDGATSGATVTDKRSLHRRSTSDCCHW